MAGQVLKDTYARSLSLSLYACMHAAVAPASAFVSSGWVRSRFNDDATGGVIITSTPCTHAPQSAADSHMQ
jgi:hypothetical protein